jgi:HEXXH motif-containing protein
MRSASPEEARALASELRSLLAFDLAWLGALPCPVTLRRLPQRLVSLTARAALDLPEGLREAMFDNGAMHCEWRGGGVTLDLAALAHGAEHAWLSRPYRAVRGDLVLALADNNPLSNLETHPEKTTPNKADLGGRNEDEWRASIEGALGLVDRHLPGLGHDIDLLVQQIVPTGYEPQRHLSCSYQEDIGTIYVSLHPSIMTMAEALIHEASHNKLNALFELDPVIENGDDERYASPVRPDPRPLRGILLAVHAFVPVACLYERLLRAGATEQAASNAPLRRELLEARLAVIARANRAGTDVLRTHARPTRMGRGLLDELSMHATSFGVPS